MKKIISMLLAVMVIFGMCTAAMAEETEVVSEAASYEMQTEVKFHAEIKSTEKKVRNFAFMLYACDGQTELGRSYVNTKDWETSFNMEFTVPEYNIGEKFIIKLFSDNAELSYNGITGKEAILETYVTADAEGNILYQTAFYGEIIPAETKNVVIKVDENTINKDYSVFGNEIYVSEDFLPEINIELVENENSWTLKSQTKDFYMNFYKDNIYATRNSEGYNLNYPVFEDGEKAYFPLYDIAVYFACSYKEEAGEDRVITMTKSAYSKVDAKEKFVNDSGVSSKTEYLIWISKSTYTVNVFKGTKGNWHLYKS